MKVCLLIPCFDHGREVGGVVESLAFAGLPCLIVDDGSGPATRAALDELADRHAWVEVERRARNGGRGAALETGYREALRRGFSHAVQLDADGQHAPEDVPRFLERMAEHPEALVLGAPRFDETAPKSRLYGRQLSRAMVWLSTFSFDVEDPLCGFRGIPLATTVDLLDEIETGDHMEFDPELVIRLHWRGVPVENIPTRVVYNEGGLSHFDMRRDNARMTGLYARSLVGGIARLPGRLLRRRPRAAGAGPGRWTQMAEIGTIRSLRFAAWFFARFGRIPSLVLLSGAAAYYYLRHEAAPNASLLYLRRVAASPEGRASLGRPPGALAVWRHLLEFGISLYDRILVWGGALDRFELEHDGTGLTFDLAREGRGALLLGAHLGSLDMMAIIADRHDLVVNVVGFQRNAERINATLESLGETRVRMIELDPESVDAAFRIRACIDRGEHVAILADRAAPGKDERSAEVSFLGRPARFPLGPFWLASVLGCPAYLALCLRTGPSRYVTRLRPVAMPGRVPRDEREKRAGESLERYVALLEESCLRFPYQWFNFYDFWGEGSA